MRSKSSTTELAWNRHTSASKKLNGPRFFNRRRSMLAAATALGLATSVWGQTTQPTALYFDNNGTATGVGSGTAVWNATTADWNANSSGAGAVGTWQSGEVANFNAGFTVDLLDAETIGGLSFNTGATTITTTVGTTGEQLDIGTSTYNPATQTGGYFITQNATTSRQVIAVPIVGSGDIVAVSNQSNSSYSIDFAGNMSQFTGNLYLNSIKAGTSAQFQVDSPMGGSGTVYMEQNVAFTDNNAEGSIAAPDPGTAGDPVTAATLGLTSPLEQTPNIYTISNNIQLNYTSNSTTPLTSNNNIGAANGPSYTINGTTYDFSKIVTYSGVISSPTSGTSNLIIGGPRGTTILEPMANGVPSVNTYNGNTQVEVADTNGLFQIGNSGAIPATSNLIIGSGGSVGPTDLDGNSINIAELYTGDTGTAATTVGNIYNLTVNNPSFNAGAGYYQNLNANPATITIAPTATTGTGTSSGQIFYGDIGDTNIGGSGVTYDPFTDNAPYSNGDNDGSEYVTANTNISLVLNPTSGGNLNIFTLAPVDTYSGGTETGLKYGNEYTGTTTINSNAALVLGRGFDQQEPDSYSGGPGVGIPNSNFTLNGGGDVYVNSGGTLASLASSSGYAIGGAQGTIYLYAGSSFLPGEAQMYNNKAAVTHTEAATNTVSLSPNNVGTLVSQNIVFDENASMTFSIANAASFDYVFLYGNLSLDDSNPDHNINIDLASGGVLSPGDYNLISAAGGIAGPVSAYALNTSGLNAPNDVFSLALYTNPNTGVQSLQLQVIAPDLQWDYTGQGQNNYQNGVEPIVTEGVGTMTWADGVSPFYSQIPHQEVTWSNTATNQVIIGDDGSQTGGAITLGSNIVVQGGIFFGPIQPGSNYSLVNASGNSYTLTIGGPSVANATPGGIEVENSAATSTTPSAEIDVPIILTGSQTWSIASGAFLNVTGSVNENDTTGADTLTVTGDGVLDLSGTEGANVANGIGDLGTISVQDSSIVLLGSATAIGPNTTINLNGGGVEYAYSASPTNPITFGSNGGALGATANSTVSNTLTYSPNITDAYSLEVFGTGTTNLNGTVTVGATATPATLEIAAASGGTAGTVNFGNTVSIPGGSLDVVGGNVTFTHNVSASALSVTGTSTTIPNVYFAATNTDTFSTITIGGGMVYAPTQAALSTAPVTFTGAPGGGLNVVGMTTLSNSLTGNGSGAGAGGNSFGDAVYFDETTPLTISGATGGTGDLRFDGVTGGTGTAPNPQLTFSGASTRSPGGAVYYNADNLQIDVTSAMAMGLSTQAFMQDASGYANYTIDVDGSLIATSGDLRGEPATGGAAFNTSTGFTITKIGTGLLSTSGSAGSGYIGTVDVDEGELAETSTTGIGGTAAAIIAINVNGPTAVFGADFSSATRTGDSFTLTNGGTLRRDNVAYTETVATGTIASAGFSGETDIVAASSADVITIAGTGGTIEDAADASSPANAAITNTLFTISNPVVVDTGATLNLQNDNTGGYDNGYLWAFRGPTSTSNDYDTLTIQAGATVTTDNGPGQIRFGRTNSQGVPIIAQGTPGSESTLQLGVAGGNDDVYMTTNNGTAGEYNTIFVVEGTGTAGLRIEAPMDATYEDVTAAGVTPQTPEGTTGLFGVNNTVTAGTLPAGLASGFYGSIANAFTVMSPARLAALSSYTYTDASGNVQTITPSGTLTLAANDQTSVSGTMLGGPGGSTVTNLSLAFDNTAPQSGALTGVTYTYGINPAANSAGGLFSNFAGLTIQRTYSTGASVTAQLLGTTLIPALNFQLDPVTNLPVAGTHLDISSYALAVDPGAGASSATAMSDLSAIETDLKSGYDAGKWDGPGIISSAVAGMTGTSVGYALNSALPAADQFTNFDGQAVSPNAVLVKYTWMGDLNLDGVVNSEDLTMMGELGMGDVGWIGGDLNYDGQVNADDWSLFFLGDAAYNASGQTISSEVPEPAAASLLIAGAGMLLRRRRRA